MVVINTVIPMICKSFYKFGMVSGNAALFILCSVVMKWSLRDSRLLDRIWIDINESILFYCNYFNSHLDKMHKYMEFFLLWVSFDFQVLGDNCGFV